MNTLPKELLARILSFLPLNRDKEQLAKVSRQFFDALLLPAAHGNWSFPERYPLHHIGARHHFSDLNEPARSYRCLCPYLKLQNAAAMAGLIPDIIRTVYLQPDSSELQLDACPVLANVKVLSLILTYPLQWLSLIRLFPNVEVLQVHNVCGVDCQELNLYLSQLSNLRWLEVSEFDIECALPQSCKLVILIEKCEDNLLGYFPDHVMPNVVSLTLRDWPHQEEDSILDMSIFSGFSQLQYLRITWHLNSVFLENMHALPKTVSRVCVANEEQRFQIGWSSFDWETRKQKQPGSRPRYNYTPADAEWAARVFTLEEDAVCAYELTRQT